MVLDRLNVFQSDTIVWPHFGQPIDQVFHCFVDVWVLWVPEVPIQNLVHDLVGVLASKHLLTARHLKNDAAEGPQIGVQTRLAP